mgnify:FL=1
MEARRLAENGFQELVLTGIHLSSYGIDCDSSLLELIQTLHEIDGIERIRLGSLEPGIITESFVQALVKLPKVCPHFPSVPAERKRHCFETNEPQIHTGRISGKMRSAASVL